MDFKEIDEQGNVLFVKDNTVKLKLSQRTLTLGVIHLKDGVYSFYKHEKEQDKHHKTHSWSIPYGLLMKLDGTLNIKNGQIIISDKGLISGDIEIEMSTINTTDLQGRGKERLDGHLKSPDFFDVKKHPVAFLKFQGCLLYTSDAADE